MVDTELKQPESSLLTMRRLRMKAESLNRAIVSDIKPYLNEGDKRSFRQLPDSRSGSDLFYIATTCTALMSLVLGDALDDVYEPGRKQDIISMIIDQLMCDPWDSARLPKDNAFTAVIVLRTVAMLFKKGLVSKRKLQRRAKSSGGLRFRNKSLLEIAEDLSANAPESMRVGKYPPNPAIGYWFVDAISDLPFNVTPDKWLRLAEWGSHEFLRQISFISANNHSMMDPIAMAMASCMLARIHKQAETDASIQQGISGKLPSMAELRHGVLTFFDMQSESGIWERYFPLFHYSDVGANYCWCFEVLEAVLNEFDDLVVNDVVLTKLGKTIVWCNEYRLRYRTEESTYCGWNSGGRLSTLSTGMPECWATAIVHAFLIRLRNALSKNMQSTVLEKYGISAVQTGLLKTKRWDDILDSDVLILEKRQSLKETIWSHIVEPLRSGESSFWCSDAKISTRSILLFGPSGTAKTTLVRALAEAIDWPILEITPWEFLNNGIGNIYSRANEVFDDLLDLTGVVILFDEVDALVQSRDVSDKEPRLDVTRQFLTTSMLPRLAKLHDRGKILFFMNTNFKKNFDPAITGPGRFDMLLCVGPPSWNSKKTSLNTLLPVAAQPNWRMAVEKIDGWLRPDQNLMDTLEHSTYAEMKAFLRHILDSSREQTLVGALDEIGSTNFVNEVRTWGNYISLRTGTSIRDDFENDRKASRIQ